MTENDVNSNASFSNGLSIKPNLAHDITFSAVTPNDVAYTQGAARRGSFTD
jgi:hypothetical protein